MVVVLILSGILFIRLEVVLILLAILFISRWEVVLVILATLFIRWEVVLILLASIHQMVNIKLSMLQRDFDFNIKQLPYKLDSLSIAF